MMRCLARHRKRKQSREYHDSAHSRAQQVEMAMRRFELDRAIMVKRWRQEWEIHDRDFNSCHCGLGMGTMRKHRPRESHPASSCSFCAWTKAYKFEDRRRDRRAGRLVIADGLVDTTEDTT